MNIINTITEAIARKRAKRISKVLDTKSVQNMFNDAGIYLHQTGDFISSLIKITEDVLRDNPLILEEVAVGCLKIKKGFEAFVEKSTKQVEEEMVKISSKARTYNTSVEENAVKFQKNILLLKQILFGK